MGPAELRSGCACDLCTLPQRSPGQRRHHPSDHKRGVYSFDIRVNTLEFAQVVADGVEMVRRLSSIGTRCCCSASIAVMGPAIVAGVMGSYAGTEIQEP